MIHYAFRFIASKGVNCFSWIQGISPLLAPTFTPRFCGETSALRLLPADPCKQDRYLLKWATFGVRSFSSVLSDKYHSFIFCPKFAPL